MDRWIYILHATSEDGASELYASTEAWDPEDSPGDVVHTLQLGEVGASIGESVGGSIDLDLGSWVIGNATTLRRPLDAYESVEWAGGSATLYRVRPRAAWSTREQRLAGSIENGLWSPREISLSLRGRGGGWEDTMADPYYGLGEAVIFTSASQQIDCGSTWQPAGAFSMMLRLWVPSQPPVVPTVQSLVDGLFFITMRTDDSFRLGITTSTPESVSVDSTPIPERDRWYWITATYDPTSGDARIWWDREDPAVATASTAAALVDTGASLILGSSASATYLGIVGEWRAFDIALTEDQSAELQVRPLDAQDYDELSVVAHWPGDTNPVSPYVTLYDYGPSYDESTASSPYDGTITGSIEIGHHLEGGPGLTGSARPLRSGRIENGAAVLVAPNDLIFQWCVGPSGWLEGVYDAGVAYTRGTMRSSLLDLLQNQPTAGTFDWYPKLGLLRLRDRSEGGAVTVDGWGASPWGTGLYFNGSSDFVDFGLTYGATTRLDFTWAARIHILDPTTDSTVVSNYAPNGRGFKVEYELNRIGPRLLCTLSQSPSDVELAVDLSDLWWRYGSRGEDIRIAPFSIAVVADRTTPVARVYLNGVLAGESTAATGTLLNSTQNLYLGAAPTDTDHCEMLAADVQVWERALSEDEVREYCLAPLPDGTDSDPDLQGWYRCPMVLGSTWENEGSAGGSVSISGPAWGASPAAASTPECVHRILRDHVEISFADIDATRAFTMSQAPIGVDLAGVDGPEPAILDALVGAHGYLAYSRSDGKWRIGRVENPWDLTADPGTEIDVIGEQIGWESTSRPARFYEVGYRRIFTTQRDEQLLSGSDEDRRVAVGIPIRFAEVVASEVASRVRQTFDGAWVARGPAAREARRQRRMGRMRPRAISVELPFGDLEIAPGEVVAVFHENLAAAGENFVVLTASDSFGSARLLLWRPGEVT